MAYRITTPDDFIDQAMAASDALQNIAGPADPSMDDDTIAELSAKVPEVAQFAKLSDARSKLASAERPEHAERHHDELITVEIPYSVLIQVTEALQGQANDYAERVVEGHNKFRKLSELPEGIQKIMGPSISEAISNDAMTNLKYAWLAGEFNLVRIAERPDELPDPHNDGATVKLGLQLSEKDQKDLDSLGDESEGLDWDAWAQGLTDDE